jgi:OmpA-OmpF porin, OOP family
MSRISIGHFNGMATPAQAARPWVAGLAAGLTMTLLASSVLAQASPRAANGDQPVSANGVPAERTRANFDKRSTSMMAQGLFDGDRLTPEAQRRLTDFIIDSVGRQVEIALIIPRGPWVVEGGAHDERSLTPERLNAIRSFLAQRGLDRDRIVVESRVEEKLAEPRLDVQVITREPRY